VSVRQVPRTPEPRQVIADELGHWVPNGWFVAGKVVASLAEAGMAVVTDGQAFIDGEVREIQMRHQNYCLRSNRGDDYPCDCQPIFVVQPLASSVGTPETGASE
jgi:hypothetical protein